MEQIRFEYRSSPSYKLFRKGTLDFMRPRISPSSTFNAPNSLGLTYVSRLRVGLSHLPEHKLRHLKAATRGVL